jgi:ankyrin repeat protein
VRTPANVRETLVAEHRRTFDLLLEHGADPNGDPAQISPLRQAVLVGYPPIVATLVARGADPAVAHPSFGTVLQLAQELVDEEGGAAAEEILATLRSARPPR